MISRTHFLLMVTYACVIHKVQGLTIRNTVVVLDLNKNKNLLIMANYMLHLSREKSLLGLTIVVNLKNEFVKAHPNVI